MNRAITRYTPSSDIFRDRFDRIFQQMLSQSFGPNLSATAPGEEEVSNRLWMPAVDISETADALTVKAELPGIRKEDVRITVEDHVLTLSGERKFEKDASGEDYHRIERAYGAFARSFTLPANVKTDKVEAAFQDGVLTVKLPKMEEAKPRTIEIR